MVNKLVLPLDKFLAAGVHVGLTYRTRFLKDFIYKVRPDGLAVLNIQKISKRIEIVARFLSQYEPDEILVACRRDSGHVAVEEFCKATGAKCISGRYPPGSLTKPGYSYYIEPKVLFVCDPWPDKNVISDALKINIPVVGLVDTNNTTNNLDLILPCNNKGRKSISLIFYVLAREFLKNKGISDKDVRLKDFLRMPKKKSRKFVQNVKKGKGRTKTKTKKK